MTNDGILIFIGSIIHLLVKYLDIKRRSQYVYS
nr:MAG TPA: hypothetical protein [Caudoviricetes sp.]